MIGSIQKNIIKKKIIKTDDNEDYLIRYTLFNCKHFSIKIHKILKSDDMCLHDHPWKFYSFIIKGGYWEYTPLVNQHKTDVSNTYNGVDSQKKWYGQFSFLVRPAHWIHRLEIPENSYVLTFVITLKKTKNWGFFTPNYGFINFRNYNSNEHCE